MNIVDLMAKDLHLDPDYLYYLIRNANRYYRNYTIPKRTNGTRWISQPSPELKTLQYWIVENVFSSLPVSKAAFAYLKGRSIKTHAYAHLSSSYFLHVDISQFFPSIHPLHLSRVVTDSDVFSDPNIDVDESIRIINKICFKKDSLSIGAVSSPAISNIIMYSFDCTMIDYCKANHFIYSRYADDIYISSEKYIERDVLDFVNAELKKLFFTVNPDKTKFFSSKYQKRITGLVLTTDGKVSIGTKRRCEIKKMLYDKLVKGTGDSEQILGYLSFLRDIEPETYNNLIIKYSSYCDDDLFDALKE